MANPPFLPPLDNRYEREPALIHGFYSAFPIVPAGLYTAYKVKDGDTLSSIALRAGISAKSLMTTAFGTTDPREVNWYLRNKVGCKKHGPAKMNYAFSSSADPGLIWIENRVYARLVKAPLPVPHIYNVPKPLPGYMQKNTQGCWAASVANLYDWKKFSGRRTSTTAVYEIGLLWGMRYDAKGFLRGPEFKNFATDAGLKPYPLAKFLDDHYWMNSLKRNGPFLILQHAYGDWLHWLNVVGYKLTAEKGLWITVYDVGSGRRSSVDVDVLYESSLTAHTSFPRVYGY